MLRIREKRNVLLEYVRKDAILLHVTSNSRIYNIKDRNIPDKKIIRKNKIFRIQFFYLKRQ